MNYTFQFGILWDYGPYLAWGLWHAWWVSFPSIIQTTLLGLVLVACYAVDRKTWADAGLAHWLPLRWRLTVVATLSCVFGAAGT